jgi:hypothetical protein
MNMFSYIKTKWIIQYVLCLVCISFAFSFLVIKDFSHPLAGGGDIEYWEYTGFYFSKNLILLPFPHLNLINNQAFYPYGVNGVFQPWSVERDIFYSVFYSVFGLGAWLQFYYLFTVLVTAIGTLVLLVKDYGFVRAGGAGLLVSFFNFYAIHKYPGHLSYAVVHWTVLSLVTDFLIVKKIVLRQGLSLKLILIRACLLMLSLGLELGYIAGFALMSLAVSSIFTIVLLGYRYFKARDRLVELFESTLKNYKSELFAYPLTSIALLSLSVVAGYINIPLVLQISREAKSFDFTGVPSGAWWAHPLRLLIPFFPSFNPGQVVFEQVLKDSPEGLGAGSPGWFLLILGTVGLWQARKRILVFIPLLIIFFLCLSYNPVDFPTLKIFPWFSFTRVQGRCTVLYPVILCLFALNVNFDGLRSRSKHLLSVLLVFLACTELYTAYALKLNEQPYSFDKNFFTYMNYVKEQPGEAVLDWPFCVIGGNSVGGDSLCLYFTKNASIFALRRFHEKKVMGQYFGRLHPSQIEPYLQAGWDKLFFPDNPDALAATHQARCFRPQEWSFFTDFYKFNDFAGINLYVDLLPAECINEFYARFGTPSVETEVPWAGAVKFIPKSLELRNQVNLNLGASLKFKPNLDFSESDLIQTTQAYKTLRITGLNTIDRNDSGTNQGRWAFGPESKLEFWLAETQDLELSLQFENPIEGQDVVVEINGEDKGKIMDIRAGEIIKRKFKFKSVTGLNMIVFRYNNWNQKKTGFAPEDDRRFAVYFTKLAIRNLN